MLPLWVGSTLDLSAEYEVSKNVAEMTIKRKISEIAEGMSADRKMNSMRGKRETELAQKEMEAWQARRVAGIAGKFSSVAA